MQAQISMASLSWAWSKLRTKCRNCCSNIPITILAMKSKQNLKRNALKIRLALKTTLHAIEPAAHSKPLLSLARTLRFVESSVSTILTSRANNLLPASVLLIQSRLENPDTLFIIGRGPSRDKVAQSQLDLVQKSRSISINSIDPWGIAPTLVLLENAKPDQETGPYAKETQQSHPTSLSRRMQIKNSTSTFLFHRSPFAETAKVAPALFGLRNCFAYSSVNLMTPRREHLKQDFESALRLSKSSQWPLVVPSAQASVLRAISIALIGKAKKIVLIGIDLATTSSAHGAEPGSNWVHPTAQKLSARHFPVQEVLEQIAFGTKALQLFVGHPSSLLAEFLPIFDWESECKHKKST